MAELEFGVNINLDNNELVNSRAENTTGITPGNIGRFIYDTGTNRLAVDQGGAVKQVAYIDDLAGGVYFMGGYNATTNVPDLTTSPNGILKGQMWVVTTAGTFFGEAVQINDSIIARVDNPSSLADWVVVQGNNVQATETIMGIAKIATQAITDAGTNDTDIVTPLKLKNASFVTKKYESAPTSVGGGVAVTFTHNLNNTTPAITIKRESTGAVVQLAIQNFTANSFDVIKNGAAYNVIVGVQG